QVTRTVRTPSAAYLAKMPPVPIASSSGCACTAIRVSGCSGMTGSVRDGGHPAVGHSGLKVADGARQPLELGSPLPRRRGRADDELGETHFEELLDGRP